MFKQIIFMSQHTDDLYFSSSSLIIKSDFIVRVLYHEGYISFPPASKIFYDLLILIRYYHAKIINYLFYFLLITCFTFYRSHSLGDYIWFLVTTLEMNFSPCFRELPH